MYFETIDWARWLLVPAVAMLAAAISVAIRLTRRPKVSAIAISAPADGFGPSVFVPQSTPFWPPPSSDADGAAGLEDHYRYQLARELLEFRNRVDFQVAQIGRQVGEVDRLVRPKAKGSAMPFGIWTGGNAQNGMIKYVASNVFWAVFGASIGLAIDLALGTL